MTTIADVVLAKREGRKFIVGEPEEELLFASFCLQNIHQSYAQRLQDLWVLYELGTLPGHFVDFGAGNGRDSSNSYILHKAYGWSGLLIEPNEDYEDNLRHHASDDVEWYVGMAVGANEQDNVDFLVSSDPSISTLHYTVDADSHGSLRRQLPNEVRKIKQVTLASLVEENEFLDYLSIDTEGSEFDILEAYYSSPREKFRTITVEHNYNQVNRNKLYDLLTSQGYVRRFTNYSGHDDWYILKSAIRDKR